MELIQLILSMDKHTFQITMNLICEFNTWMRIYDDDHFVRKFSADAIRVYRSGDRGCIIQWI